MNDYSTTLKQLKEISAHFVHERDWDQFHDAQSLCMDISVEANELLEFFIWAKKEQLPALVHQKKEAISFEAADVLLALLMFCNKYDIDLSTAFEKKMALNRQKYPVEKAKGVNKKYNEI